MIAVIFDIDGTLTATTKVDNKCFIQAFLNVFGIDISQEEWSNFQHVTDWGITEEVIRKTQNRTPKLQEYNQILREFYKLLEIERLRDPLQFSEIQGALHFVNQLDNHADITIGIATGGWEKTALLKLNHIGIDPTKFAFANSSKFKSREAILSNTLYQATQQAHRSIDRTIYFGDGIWDFVTCKKLGIQFIGIDNQENGTLKQAGVQTVFKDYLQPELMYTQLNI